MALNLIAHVLGATDQRENIRFLVPHGRLELVLWVILSVTAGICEEAIFRGYLQRQLLALTGNAPAAIAGAAVIFGAGHIYQGYRGAVVIACYGAMFGVLAHWRKSVRPGMLAHAWQDTISGIAAGLLRR
jgi:membrane protease YdiL (CAAX protease family)